VELSIKKNVEGTDDTKSVPAALKNDGIQVVFCGVAVTAERTVGPSGKVIGKRADRTAGREDWLERVWQSVFTKPDAVTFEPYCPKTERAR
jgi:hypothetical protein